MFYVFEWLPGYKDDMENDLLDKGLHFISVGSITISKDPMVYSLLRESIKAGLCRASRLSECTIEIVCTGNIFRITDKLISSCKAGDTLR